MEKKERRKGKENGINIQKENKDDKTKRKGQTKYND